MMHIPSRGPMCKSKIVKCTTTFTVDLISGVVVVRNVPAWICTQCGEEWIEDEVSIKLEAIAERAIQHRTQLEMVSFS